MKYPLQVGGIIFKGENMKVKIDYQVSDEEKKYIAKLMDLFDDHIIEQRDPLRTKALEILVAAMRRKEVK